MTDKQDDRCYAVAPFTGKAGKEAQEKFERKAAEKDDKRK